MPSTRLHPATHRRVRRPPGLSAVTDAVDTDASGPDAPPGRGGWYRLLAAALGGTLVALSLPPWGFWPLAFVGVVIFEVAQGAYPTRRQAAWRGFAFGLPWMAIGMCWMWFLTVPGYIVVAIAFAGFHAAAAAMAPTGPWRTLGRPAAHTLVETIRLGFPFGGVPLATLGIAQAGGPLLGVARIGGVILLTWIVFQVGCALAGPAPAIPRTMPARAVGRGRAGRAGTSKAQPHGALALLAIVLVIVLAAIAPEGRELDTAPLTVAAVQGGGEQGTSALDVPSQQVTDALLAATATIDPSAELDLVVWPENGIDVDDEPFAGSADHAAVTSEAARLGVPFSVGVTEDSQYASHPSEGAFVNAQVVVTPGGEITSRYEKVRTVPFGEYVPFRGVLEALGAPLDEVPNDAVAGQDPAVNELPDGTRLGVMISWEVFFGGRGRAATTADGTGDTSILVNPTNGASYTGTVLQSQQIASSKLRAVETGRWVV
ncbi:MAG TPA: apolipoprotein N-acyltransferase, partial [Ilumatobacter sp.]|nr:apolipoprotein N-acyltransferase [Ilumatobacter sp.]